LRYPRVYRRLVSLSVALKKSQRDLCRLTILLQRTREFRLCGLRGTRMCSMKILSKGKERLDRAGSASRQYPRAWPQMAQRAPRNAASCGFCAFSRQFRLFRGGTDGMRSRAGGP
jgi:hypothetical protein